MTTKIFRLHAWTLLLLLIGMSTASAADQPTGILAAGTPFATPYYVQDSGQPGPTMFITGGVHGNEPAGAYAAEQIRHWKIQRGKVIVVPRSKVQALNNKSGTRPKAPKSLKT